MTLAVRPATPADPADSLLYLSAKPYYDAYAGSESRARSMLAAVYTGRGTRRASRSARWRSWTASWPA